MINGSRRNQTTNNKQHQNNTKINNNKKTKSKRRNTFQKVFFFAQRPRSFFQSHSPDAFEPGLLPSTSLRRSKLTVSGRRVSWCVGMVLVSFCCVVLVFFPIVLVLFWCVLWCFAGLCLVFAFAAFGGSPPKAGPQCSVLMVCWSYGDGWERFGLSFWEGKEINSNVRVKKQKCLFPQEAGMTGIFFH